jgi:hypothetical protein
MIPEFNDDRIKFVIFIQKNITIFDELLLSGKYDLTEGLNHEHIIEAYNFLKGFDLQNNGNNLIDNLDGFNDDSDSEDDYYYYVHKYRPPKTDINLIINEFQEWLKTENVMTYFNKKVKEQRKKTKEQLNEKKSKRRTMKRTFQIKNELKDIGYVPDDRLNSIKGTIYRRKKNSFDKNKTITKRESNGGKKKKKTNKNMRFK